MKWNLNGGCSPTWVLAARWKMTSMFSVMKIWFTNCGLHTSPCAACRHKMQDIYFISYAILKKGKFLPEWKCNFLCFQALPDSWDCSSNPTAKLDLNYFSNSFGKGLINNKTWSRRKCLKIIFFPDQNRKSSLFSFFYPLNHKLNTQLFHETNLLFF